MATVPKVYFMEQKYTCIFLLKFRHQSVTRGLYSTKPAHQPITAQWATAAPSPPARLKLNLREKSTTAQNLFRVFTVIQNFWVGRGEEFIKMKKPRAHKQKFWQWRPPVGSSSPALQVLHGRLTYITEHSHLIVHNKTFKLWLVT